MKQGNVKLSDLTPRREDCLLCEEAVELAAQDKATFHGEAEMRIEWGVLMGKSVAQSNSRWAAELAAETVGGKAVRRTVTASRWVEVDA